MAAEAELRVDVTADMLVAAAATADTSVVTEGMKVVVQESETEVALAVVVKVAVMAKVVAAELDRQNDLKDMRCRCSDRLKSSGRFWRHFQSSHTHAQNLEWPHCDRCHSRSVISVMAEVVAEELSRRNDQKHMHCRCSDLLKSYGKF